MTLPATARRAGPYNSNGVTTAFGFTFKVFDEADVRVVVNDDGVESDAVLNSDYTVTLNEDQEAAPGGEVIFLAAPDGPTVTVVGEIEYSQPTQLPDGGAYRARTNMNALDRLAMLIQQVREMFGRAIKFPVSDDDSLQTTLPTAGLRAGKAVVFDENGGVTVSRDDYEDQVANVSASALAARLSANDAAAAAATVLDETNGFTS